MQSFGSQQLLFNPRKKFSIPCIINTYCQARLKLSLLVLFQIKENVRTSQSSSGLFQKFYTLTPYPAKQKSLAMDAKNTFARDLIV